MVKWVGIPRKRADHLCLASLPSVIIICLRRSGTGPIRNDMSATFQTADERENARLRGDLQTIASRICHDLRTPLNAILAAADALKDEGGQIAPYQAALWDSLFVSAGELQNLIERVSFVTKSSAIPRPKVLLPMSNAVFAALTRLESRILKRGAVVVQPVAWPDVLGVSPWLEAVWWNLIANALTHGGGPIHIELGWREDGVQRFWVRDNGPGVPQNQRDRLFQPFHRLHEPDAAKGLGLTIVQRLVEMQGGSCQYEAPAEGGSCFSFTLPLAPPEEAIA